MTEQPGLIGRRMAKGAIWMVAVRLVDRSIGLVSTIILARLLLPADFGVVALAISAIAVLEIWAEFGFDLALIQNQKAERKHYDTAWTLMMLRGVTVAVLVALSAGSIAEFLREPLMEEVLYALAVISLIDGCQSIRTVDFRKNLNLHKEFRFLMTARVIQFFTTIILAYLWRDYWALVAGILVNRGARMFLSYYMAPYLPRFTLSAFSDLFGFSKWMVLNNLLNFMTTRLDTFVVGRVSGVSSLGVYAMAYEVSNMATTELVWPISRAIFPGFARLADDKTALERSYNLSQALIVLVALPVATGLALTAGYFVPILLGEKWLGVVPLMEVLAVYGGLRVIIANTGSLYFAINKPYLAAIMAAANLVVLLPAMILLVLEYGPIGAAWAVVLGSAPPIVLMFFFNAKYAGIAPMNSCLNLVRPILACGIMVGLILLLRPVFPVVDDTGSLVLGLVVLIFVGAASYVSSILILWRLMGDDQGIEQVLWTEARTRLRRRREG